MILRGCSSPALRIKVLIVQRESLAHGETVCYTGPRFRRLLQMKTDALWLTSPQYGHWWLPVPPLLLCPKLTALTCSANPAWPFLLWTSCCLFGTNSGTMLCLYLHPSIHEAAPASGSSGKREAVLLGKAWCLLLQRPWGESTILIIIMAFQYTCGCWIRTHINHAAVQLVAKKTEGGRDGNTGLDLLIQN